MPQYYTFLNQNPGRLHCFYTKKSTLIHGTEQEDATPCFGQQQINDKILSLGFEDAKVFVSNVDSQSSAAGGILIQVLGEMSNKGGPWRKFSQTFFLAEQPNGYFVLNDIFRYLKDEDEIEQEAEDVDNAIQEELDQAEKDGTDVVHQVEVNNIGASNATPAPIKSAETASSAAAIAATPAEPTDSSSAVVPGGAAPPVETAQATSTKAEPNLATPDQVGLDKKVTAAPAEEVAATQPASEESKPETPASAAAAAPAPAAPAAEAPKQEAAAPAKPAGPPKPKTWANLAASNVAQWGSTVSAEAKGISAEAKPRAAPATSGAKSGAATPAKNGATPATGGAAAAKGNANVYIKNVVSDRVPEASLKSSLESQFGAVKSCQIMAQRNCAFVEFVSVDSAKKAIAASSDKGGVVVTKDGFAVQIEERRKQQPERLQGPNNGSSFRGGRGGANTGRGGARGGANTPRGGAGAGARRGAH